MPDACPDASASIPLDPVVFVLNGPNLNMLGAREPALYGRATLSDVEARCRSVGESLGFSVEFRQSNHEGDLVDWIQEARTAARGVVLNAGAYTHTSIAIRDAILSAGLPVIEVHISNVFAREDFRHPSHVSPVAAGVIVGCGIDGYEFALHALAKRVGSGEPNETIAV